MAPPFSWKLRTGSIHTHTNGHTQSSCSATNSPNTFPSPLLLFSTRCPHPSNNNRPYSLYPPSAADFFLTQINHIKEKWQRVWKRPLLFHPYLSSALLLIFFFSPPASLGLADDHRQDWYNNRYVFTHTQKRRGVFAGQPLFSTGFLLTRYSCSCLPSSLHTEAVITQKADNKSDDLRSTYIKKKHRHENKNTVQP